VTPLYPQKLTLTSPTGGGGRSVGIVRSRTKATEFSLVLGDDDDDDDDDDVVEMTSTPQDNTAQKILPNF
jgi:hypothetical protein